MGRLNADSWDAGDWVAIVANPYSGSLENRGRVGELVEALGRRGLEGRVIWERGALAAVLHPSGGSGGAEASGTSEVSGGRGSRRFGVPGAGGRGCRCVVAAGGDGTVSLVVHERPQVSVAVLPLGTENLFAGHFGFTGDVEELAGAIAAGRTRAIDLGRAGNRLFGVVASAGFDADVAHRLATWRVRGEHLRRVRRRTYIQPIVRATMGYGYPMLDVEADGRHVRGALVLVFNLPRYGFGFELCPGAVADDGLLDYVVLERPGRFRLASYVLAMMRGCHLDRPDVHHGRFRRLRIRSVEPVPMEIDGEAAGFTPCDVEVLPGAMRVVEMGRGEGN